MYESRKISVMMWCDCCDVMTDEGWLPTSRSDSIYDVIRSRDPTGSDSPVHRKWPRDRKWLYNRKSLPSPPEVTSQPEVTAQGEVTTWPEVNPELVPSPPEVTSQPEVTLQSTGSGCATGSQEVVRLNCFIAQWNNWSLYLCCML